MRLKLFALALTVVLSLSAAAFALAFNSATIFRPPVVVHEEEPPPPIVQLPPDRYVSPPPRDLYDLARRLRPGYRSSVANPPEQPRRQVGDQQVFWVVDLDALVPLTVTTTLEYITPHAYFYVQDGSDVAASDLRRSAEEFEQHIYPTEHRYLGSEWLPGIDNDEHLTIVNARMRGASGYYSMIDEYPTDINPYSNQREMFYMNLSSVRPGNSGYNAVLAHEFAHAIHWNMHRNEETWLAEGLAELAATLVGYRSSAPASYAASPDTQLDAWGMGSQSNAAHYGAGTLFMMYLAQHYGGYDALREIITQSEDGIDGVNAYLSKHGYAARFEDVYRDWVVANYLDDPRVERYHYQDTDAKAKIERVVDDYGEWSESVHQFGANYIQLSPPSPGARVSFAGDTSVPLAHVQPRSGGRMWWSNRGDAIDTTLTRELDLTSVESATLKYWVWYDIERSWDYAYVEASTDAGATWTIMEGTHSSVDNPLGLSFGPGYTGASGDAEPEWQQEEVDLSPYAGQRVLLRFEYVTDEGTNGPSFFLDDVEVPEIGLVDDVEGESAWQSSGFLRTDGVLPQRYILQLIKLGPPTTVESIDVGADGKASFSLEGSDSTPPQAVLIVSGSTPVTTEGAHYRLSVEPPG